MKANPSGIQATVEGSCQGRDAAFHADLVWGSQYQCEKFSLITRTGGREIRVSLGAFH